MGDRELREEVAQSGGVHVCTSVKVDAISEAGSVSAIAIAIDLRHWTRWLGKEEGTLDRSEASREGTHVHTP